MTSFCPVVMSVIFTSIVLGEWQWRLSYTRLKQTRPRRPPPPSPGVNVIAFTGTLVVCLFCRYVLERKGPLIRPRVSDTRLVAFDNVLRKLVGHALIDTHRSDLGQSEWNRSLPVRRTPKIPKTHQDPRVQR